MAPRGTSPAAVEAHRRALRRLEASGLVGLSWQAHRGQRETIVPAHTFYAAGEHFDMEECVQRQSWRSRRRAVQLTPLGQAVVSDGSAVLGLGDIGAAAALPVMEGKCALFKAFAGLTAGAT